MKRRMASLKTIRWTVNRMEGERHLLGEEAGVRTLRTLMPRVRLKKSLCGYHECHKAVVENRKPLATQTHRRFHLLDLE